MPKTYKGMGKYIPEKYMKDMLRLKKTEEKNEPGKSELGTAGSAVKIDRRKYLKYLAAGIVVVAAAGGAYYAFLPRAPEVPKEIEKKPPIKIGNLTSITGVYSNWGNGSVMAVGMGIDKINAAGGLLGRPVEQILEDDQVRPDVGSRKAEKLILDDKVDAIIGCVSSSVTLAVQPITGKYKTIHLNGISCADDMRSSKLHPYFFNTLHDTRHNSFGLVPFLVRELGMTKPYLLYVDYSMGIADERGFRMVCKREGVTTVGRAGCPLGTPDYTPWFPAIVKAEPDWLYCGLATPDTIRLYHQLFAYGLTGPKGKFKLSGIACMLIEPELGQYGEVMEGFYHITYYNTKIDTPTNKKFVEEHIKRYGILPGTNCQNYVSIWLYKDAVEKAASTDPDKVSKALEGIEHKGPGAFCSRTEKVTMRASDHEIIYDGQIGQIVKGVYNIVYYYDGELCAGEPKPGYTKPLDDLYLEGPWPPAKPTYFKA